MVFNYPSTDGARINTCFFDNQRFLINMLEIKIEVKNLIEITTTSYVLICCLKYLSLNDTFFV